VIRALKFIDNIIEKVTLFFLTLSILLMLGFSLATIGLRFFQLNYPWFESVARHLVLLSAFLGGVIATGKGTHIGIDVIGHYLESENLKKPKIYLLRLIQVVSFATVCWLAKASFDFMKVEMEFGTPEFFGLSSGHLVAIIPIGFLLIAIRFLLKFLISFEEITE
jgi:TRAP-type C4-dicarboxylate transport system permease small subunit